MNPSGPSGHHEERLRSSAPVYTNVRREARRMQREAMEVNAKIREIEARGQMRHKQERVMLRAKVDNIVEGLVGGTEGIVPPSVLDPPIERILEPCFLRPTEKKQTCTGSGMAPVKLISLASSAGRMPDDVRSGRYPGGSPSKGVTPRNRVDASESKAGEPPRGFPVPFESSGFRCPIQWAEMSLHEVLITALGPRSERERRGTDVPPNRLLVSVAAHLLNEVLSRDTRYATLWPLLRDVVFKGLFAPTNFKQSPYMGGREPPSYPSFVPAADYFGLRLWSDEYLLSRRAELHLSDRVTDLNSALDSRGDIFQFAVKQIEKASKRSAFRAWRAVVQRNRILRDNVVAYLKRVRQRMVVEGSFLRWRRLVVQTKLEELRVSLKESNVRFSISESNSKETIRELEERLEEERKGAEVMKLKIESLSMQLVEKQMLDLRTLDSTLRNYRAMCGDAKKESKRWERLAKTFSCRSGCPVFPASMKRHAHSLRSIETSCVGQGTQAYERVVDARCSLESLLVAWINSLMKDQNDHSWKAVRKIELGSDAGDFSVGALCKLVRTLDSIYNTRGAEHVMCGSAASTNPSRATSLTKCIELLREGNESSTVVFQELVQLIHKQTVDGLFPPLLSHCSYLDTFYTPSTFCQKPHPTAMLWVLATLFVGYARLVAGVPSFASHDIEQRLRCQSEASIGCLALGPVPEEGEVNKQPEGRSRSQSIVSSHILTTNTVIKKSARHSRPRSTASRKVAEEAADEKDQACEKAIVDTASDVEVYLNCECGTEEEGGYSSDGELTTSETATTHETDGLEKSTSGATEKMKHTPGSSSKPQRPARRSQLLPSTSKLLVPVGQREFVKFHRDEGKRQRMWISVCRIVTSLVVRFRILDVPTSSAVPPSFASPMSFSSSLPRLVSGRHSLFFNSGRESRRSQSGLFPVASSPPNPATKPKRGASQAHSTLRRWLDKARKAE